MGNARKAAIARIAATKIVEPSVDFVQHPLTEVFGANVFSDTVMRARLPKATYKALKRTIDEGAPLDAGVADVVATAMKDWAVERGATHYTHWFQPMTGSTAEKHDSFVVPTADGHALLGDFGAACFVTAEDHTQAQALEQIEVRAFGCLVEELLERAAISEVSIACQHARQTLADLRDRCLSKSVAQRPRFSELVGALALLLAADGGSETRLSMGILWGNCG